jgi:hypothetical protein
MYIITDWLLIFRNLVEENPAVRELALLGSPDCQNGNGS